VQGKTTAQSTLSQQSCECWGNFRHFQLWCSRYRAPAKPLLHRHLAALHAESIGSTWAPGTQWPKLPVAWASSMLLLCTAG
jgi:hypothetical protein